MDFDMHDINTSIYEKNNVISPLIYIKFLSLIIFYFLGYYLKKVIFLLFLKRKKNSNQELNKGLHESIVNNDNKIYQNANNNVDKEENKIMKDNYNKSENLKEVDQKYISNIIEDDKYINKVNKNLDRNSHQSLKDIKDVKLEKLEKQEKLKANSIDEKELLNSNYNADVNTINDNIEEDKDINHIKEIKDKDQIENNEINSKESDKLNSIEELSDDEEYVIGSIYNYNIAYSNYKLKKTLENTSHLTNTISIIDSIDKSNNTNSNEDKKSDPVSNIIKSEVKEKDNIKSNKNDSIKTNVNDENKKNKKNPVTTQKKGKPVLAPFKTFFKQNSEDFIQLYFVRIDLGMGMGKIGAQVAHSSIWIFDKVFEDNNKNSQEQFIEWENVHKKMFFTIDSVEKINLLKALLSKKGILFVIISDAGHTQIKAGSKTVLCIQPLKEREIIEKLNIDFNTYII